MSPRHLAYVSVGSVLGDRLENCRRGIAAADVPGLVAVGRCSRFYQTEPVDFTDQEWFVNAVFEVVTRLDPFELLRLLQDIQRRSGRILPPVVRYGPRVLDLDNPPVRRQGPRARALVVPHPRMHERRFVLQPICDINPDIVHPLFHRTMADLLGRLDEDGQAVIACP